jgi:hypothetical protein
MSPECHQNVTTGTTDARPASFFSVEDTVLETAVSDPIALALFSTSLTTRDPSSTSGRCVRRRRLCNPPSPSPLFETFNDENSNATICALPPIAPCGGYRAPRKLIALAAPRNRARPGPGGFEGRLGTGGHASTREPMPRGRRPARGACWLKIDFCKCLAGWNARCFLVCGACGRAAACSMDRRCNTHPRWVAISGNADDLSCPPSRGSCPSGDLVVLSWSIG